MRRLFVMLSVIGLVVMSADGFAADAADCGRIGSIYYSIAVKARSGVSMEEVIQSLMNGGMIRSEAISVVTPVYDFKDRLTPEQMRDKMYLDCMKKY